MLLDQDYTIVDGSSNPVDSGSFKLAANGQTQFTLTGLDPYAGYTFSSDGGFLTFTQTQNCNRPVIVVTSDCSYPIVLPSPIPAAICSLIRTTPSLTAAVIRSTVVVQAGSQWTNSVHPDRARPLRGLHLQQRRRLPHFHPNPELQPPRDCRHQRLQLPHRLHRHQYRRQYAP